jgi:hypothetical protein
MSRTSFVSVAGGFVLVRFLCDRDPYEGGGSNGSEHCPIQDLRGEHDLLLVSCCRGMLNL